jgi:hypothetical protein
MKRFYTVIHVLSEPANFLRYLRITGYHVPHIDITATYLPASGLGGRTGADRVEGIIELAEL